MTETRNRTDGVGAESSEPIIELTERIQPQDLENSPIIDLITPIRSSSEASPYSVPPPPKGPQPFSDTAFGLDEEMGDDSETDDFVNSLGIELPATNEPPPPETESASSLGPLWASGSETVETDAPPVLTAERIEAILERVVEKVYTEKIEGILVEVIERVVTREIERLRSLLTGEGDSDA